MSAELIDSFFALAVSSAVTRLIVSARQLLIRLPASSQLLQRGRAVALRLLMCNSIRARRLETRGPYTVMVGTFVAGCCSLLSATVLISVLVMVLSALGVPAG